MWFGLDGDTIFEGPPTLGIDHLPDEVACPAELPLTLAWADDPEQDYASLRWIVDGVLLHDTWPTLDVTQPHDVVAVLADTRGATGLARTHVACE